MSQQPGTSSSLSSAPRPNPGDVKEFNFRFPQNQRKKYSVMQFKRDDRVDLSKWTQAKMERENNKIHYKTDIDDLPKFGAGSEFGRERREEARQKKYGIIAQKYKEEDQPWILKHWGSEGKAAKKYRGRKEGRVNENSSYFILSQLADGTFEAYPVDSWYNFTAMQTYKTLNAEEAEEEFGRRDKTMNYFNVMLQKKLRDTKEEEDTEETAKKSKGSDLTLMEDDYFLSSGDELEDSDDDDGGGKSKAKKKNKGKDKKVGKKRPKKKDFDSEAEEESDEGDFDGRELDYISEQSSDDDEVEMAKTDIKGLDQELQQLEEEEEEEEEEKEDEKETKEGDKLNDSKENREKKSDESSSESSGSDSDIDENNIHSAMLLQKKHNRKSNEKTPPKSGSGSRSRSQTPTVPDNNAVTDSTLSDAAKQLENKDLQNKKRPIPIDSPATKRPRTESPVAGSSSNKTPSGHVPLTEDEVRRYLMRRPMTTKDLLVKLNPKRTGLPKEQIETKLAEILVKLAPEKRRKEKKIFWFIREHSK